jgi:hypothetical protein
MFQISSLSQLAAATLPSLPIIGRYVRLKMGEHKDDTKYNYVHNTLVRPFIKLGKHESKISLLEVSRYL